MECIDLITGPIPPMIHGQFEVSNARKVQPIGGDKSVGVQMLSAAEINFRTDIFSRRTDPSWEVDTGTLRRAEEKFLRDRILGQSFDEYCKAVADTSGLSYLTVEESARNLSSSLSSAKEKARASLRKNTFRVEDLDGLSPPEYGLMRVRKGENLSVSLPGNSPGPNSVWVESLIYGYEVILRPSFRDVYTPLRLAVSLIESGVPGSALSVLFCDHYAHDALVDCADLSLVFGSDKLERRYQGKPNVKVYGPGRSVTILDPELYGREVASGLIDSVTGVGGAACFNS